MKQLIVAYYIVQVLITCVVMRVSTYIYSYKSSSSYDVTVVGCVKFAEGLGGISVGWIDGLKDVFKINFIQTPGVLDLENVPCALKTILLNRDKRVGKVIFFSDYLWHRWASPANIVTHMSNKSIKIAYSMLESTKIPPQWVSILNNQFDAVVVPDTYYIQVYKNSGVIIPVFVIPCGLYIDDFLNKPLKIRQKDIPFVFGMSGGFWPGKNHELLIEAFWQEFGNNKNIRLKIQGRAGDAEYLRKKIEQLETDTIELLTANFTRKEYREFLYSLDCYVLLSKGEGFSITPREAMALGIPCILSNNSAHKTLAKTGLVYSVPSDILEDAYYETFGFTCGYKFNCALADVRKALKEVYVNYSEYLARAQKAKYWVARYKNDNFKYLYRTLIRPKKLILGSKNKITTTTLTTTSKKLYNKYKRIWRIS